MPGGSVGYDVFLSYRRADAAAVDQLRTRLAQDAGLKAFLDRYALPGGKPWQPELEAVLASCRALVVLLGPTGIGGWQHREIQLGLDRQTAAAKTPTDAQLVVLHERVPGAPGKEAGLDATVTWVAATFPDIDLDSPPTFPGSTSTGGAW